MGDRRDLRFTRRVSPFPQQLPLLYIPTQDILTSSDESPSGARAASSACDPIVLGPDSIRRSGRNEPERFRMLEFSVPISIPY